MNKIRRTIIIGVVAVVVVAAALLFFVLWQSSVPLIQSTGAEPIHATFACEGGKTIDAQFIVTTQATTTGNSVVLDLSDGRHFTLPQTISGSGARYASADESFVFWNKGNGAFVQENGQNTYVNCVTAPSQ